MELEDWSTVIKANTMASGIRDRKKDKECLYIQIRISTRDYGNTEKNMVREPMSSMRQV